MIKKFLTSVIILPLMIVPLFCCCVKQASAATVIEKSCHDDHDSHAANHDQSHSKDGHLCDCAQLLSTTGDQSVVFNSNFLSKFQISFDSISAEPFSVVSLKGSMRMAYLGPPGNSSAVPLYTLYHSLRI